MSSDEEVEDWMPYAERPSWSDVVPLAQDDGEHPVVQIAYSDKFRDVFDYFRAVVAAGEKSERALELTADALKLNPANYTVWQYRRDILTELGVDLRPELAHCETIVRDNPKNYQVWHHRRCIVEWLKDGSRELALTGQVLELDAKNYHAWQHRQWAIQTFGLYDDELSYVDKLLAEDVRNNSAWNQRFFVLKHAGVTADVLQREIHYTLNRIRLVKNNESSWLFLRGILDESARCAGHANPTEAECPEEVLEFCRELYAAKCRSPHLITFLVDVNDQLCLAATDDADRQRYAAEVLRLCAEMEKEHDRIRCKYWAFVAFDFQARFEQKFGQIAAAKDSAMAAASGNGVKA